VFLKCQTDKLPFSTTILKYCSRFIERRGWALGRKECKGRLMVQKQSYTVLSTRVSAPISVSKSAKLKPQRWLHPDTSKGWVVNSCSYQACSMGVPTPMHSLLPSYVWYFPQKKSLKIQLSISQFRTSSAQYELAQLMATPVTSSGLEAPQRKHVEFSCIFVSLHCLDREFSSWQQRSTTTSDWLCPHVHKRNMFPKKAFQSLHRSEKLIKVVE
jgi:hypothetical protein